LCSENFRYRRGHSVTIQSEKTSENKKPQNEEKPMKTEISRSEQFCEELYFMLMSSTMRDRFQTLASRYGLAGKPLRNQVLSVGEQMARRMGLTLLNVDNNQYARMG
jgi:hypothetical protein